MAGVRLPQWGALPIRSDRFGQGRIFDYEAGPMPERGGTRREESQVRFIPVRGQGTDIVGLETRPRHDGFVILDRSRVRQTRPP